MCCVRTYQVHVLGAGLIGSFEHMVALANDIVNGMKSSHAEGELKIDIRNIWKQDAASSNNWDTERNCGRALFNRLWLLNVKKSCYTWWTSYVSVHMTTKCHFLSGFFLFAFGASFTCCLVFNSYKMFGISLSDLALQQDNLLLLRPF